MVVSAEGSGPLGTVEVQVGGVGGGVLPGWGEEWPCLSYLCALCPLPDHIRPSLPVALSEQKQPWWECPGRAWAG